MAADFEQDPLFEPTEEERKNQLIIGGYRMTWVKGYWRRMALPRPKKEAE